MIAHYVILPIVLPAVVAGFLVLLARNNLVVQRAGGLAATTALIALALHNLGAAGQGPVPYFLGNWPAPFGIVLILDQLSALMLLLTAGLAGVAHLYAVLTRWDARGRHFHALMMFQLMGLNGAFLTADAFNLFVFFEVLLIASYGLLVHGGGAERLRMGVQYVAFNLLGSTVFLFALATIYAVTGTLNMADLAVKLPQLPAEDSALVRLSAVLLFVVFAIKGAMVPLQFWLPQSYSAASAPVAALFAVMTKLGIYTFIRFGTLVFPPTLAATGALWGDVLWWGGLAGVAMGAIGTLAAPRLAVMVGFATIGSMGAIFLAASAFTAPSLVAALYYALHSTLAAALLFLLADLVAQRRGQDSFAAPAAPFAQSGLLASLFMIAAIAMVGLPPLSGFLGKIMILQALTQDTAVAWGVILGGTLISMVGFARAGSALFWRSDAGKTAPQVPHQPLAYIPVALLIVALGGLTLGAGPVTDWLGAVVQNLIAPQAYIDVQSLPQVTP